MSERTETRSEEPTDVTLAREGGVATVTLNRPERRNALSDDLLVRLAALCADVREDERVRVVVLTGAPPVFSAGADAGLRASMSLVEQREAFLSTRTNFLPLFCRVLEALEALPQPTIASINGHAVGGGWALTLACGLPLRRRRRPPLDSRGGPRHPARHRDDGAVRPLRRPRPHQKEIVMEGRRYTAAEARDLGLVHRVVPAEALARTVREYAAMLADKPAAALAEAKARIDQLAPIALPSPEG
jgi:2-(1,2-epoxy-1,2-dihydrophenyl)acetyl-CoA isomerase